MSKEELQYYQDLFLDLYDIIGAEELSGLLGYNKHYIYKLKNNKLFYKKTALTMKKLYEIIQKEGITVGRHYKIKSK